MIKTVCAKIGNCGSSGGTYADAQEDRARGQRLFGGADAGSADGNEAVGSALSDLASGQVDLMGPLLKNAATSIFLCDESKYGRSAMYNIASLADVSYLITNAPPPARYPRPKKGIIVIK